MLVGVGALASLTLRHPRARLVFWQGILAIALLLPAIEPWTQPARPTRAAMSPSRRRRSPSHRRRPGPRFDGNASICLVSLRRALCCAWDGSRRASFVFAATVWPRASFQTRRCPSSARTCAGIFPIPSPDPSRSDGCVPRFRHRQDLYGASFTPMLAAVGRRKTGGRNPQPTLNTRGADYGDRLTSASLDEVLK